MASTITAPRGTQDLLPPFTARWQELEARLHRCARSFGYGEIRTPLFESTELFVRGVGETTDIVEKEMYTFADKGGRSMTLRPEWTAPVVRAALEQKLLSEGPRRLYYIGPIFRYERPQKGRYRQSHQFGVECFGYTEPQADAEVISLAWQLLQSYGLGGVELRLNSIGDERCRTAYRAALLDHFRPHAAQLSEDSQRRLERNPLRLLDSKAPQDRELVESAPSFASLLCEQCREHFDGVRSTLEALGVPYVVDPKMVRGLDYYTRTVFEFVSDALGAQSTVCAGGRYDNLVASLGGPEVPAVGFAMGMERLLLVIESGRGDVEAEREGVQLIPLGGDALAALLPISAALRRNANYPVYLDYANRKLLAQLKLADRNGARLAAILGSDELQRGEIVVRDLVRRSERRVPIGEVEAALQPFVEVEV